jgi:hypothetical protein
LCVLFTIIYLLYKYFKYKKDKYLKIQKREEMANTGILYRRNVKSFFEKDNNKPIEGEIVYATDTHEYGALDEDGSIVWRQHEGSVISINGRQGEIHLDKVDVGLSNVDNTSDNDKPLSSAIKKELKEHYEATNPHHVTPQQIGLGNVENTSDIDKPISRLTQTALDLKLDKSAIPANAKFTDTTYEIKDGELSEYNFNKSYKDKLDYLSTNRQLLSAGNALRAQGRNIILTRADGSTETIETQDTIYDDTNVLQTLSNILTKFDTLNIKDNLNSENGVLSAKQGKILNDKITEIKEMLKSDNVDLDSLQEIVTFIENNKHLIDSLEIDNIANLRNVLNSKCDFVNEQGTVRNALNFDNHEISDFVMKRDYLNYKNNIDNSIATINTKFSLYYTKSETDSKIQLAVDSIDYSDINKKIDNNFNALNDKISAIDYTYIATDLQNAKTQLEAKDLEIQTDLTNKYSELKTTINSINFAQINSDIANLNKLIKDNSLGDLNTNVTNNKAKIDEILNNLQLYLKKSEFTDEINKEYAQNIEPKINEKISRLVTQNDLLNKTTELNSLITKLQEKLNSTNSDLSDVEDDVSNIYHLLHNVKVDLSSYYTKAEVDAKVAAGGTFDASQYYNKSEVDSKVASAGNFNAALYYPKTETYSKSEVEAKIPDVSLLAKKSETYNKTDINVLLHDYAKKSELPDFTRYYEKSQIDYAFVKKTEISSLQNQVSANAAKLVDVYQKHQVYNKSEIDSKIASAGNFDASQYYNKDEIDNNFVTKEKIHDDYYAKSETEQKISEKATEIDSKITEIKSQLTDYYRQSETYSKAEVDTKIKEMKDNKNHDFDDIYTKYDLLPLEITENTDVKKHPKIKRLNSNEEGITDNYGYNSRTIESCPEVLAQQDIRITNSAFPEQFLNDPLVFWNKDIKSKESNTQFILNDKDNIYIKFYKDIRLSESEYTAEYFKNNVFLLNDQRCRKLNFVFYINDTLSVICDSYFATVQEVSSKKYKISYESEGFKYDATSQELEFYIDLNNIEVINNEGENTFYLKIKNSPENKTLERKYLFFPLPDLYIDSKDNTDYEKIKNELDTYTSKLLRKQNNMNPYVPMTMIYDQTDGETETTNKNITSDRTKLTEITFALNPLENDFDYRDESIIYKVLRVNLGLYFDNDNTKLLNYFKTNFNITTFGYTTLMLEDSYLCLNLKSVDNNNYGFGRKFKGNVTLDSKVFTFEFDYGITIKENRESKLDFPYKDYKYTSVYFVLQSPIKISGNGISKTLKIRDVVDLGFQIPYSSTLTYTNYLGICMYGDFRMNDIWLKYNFFLRNNDITQSMSLQPNQYIKYQEKTFGDKLSEKAINVDNVIVKRDLSSFSPSNISSTIRTNIHDGAGILLPSENWKSVQNFQTVSDTRDFQIFVNYENPKSGVLVNDEKRCVSGVILIDVRHDNGLEITTLSGQEIIKINEFDKTSFKRGINIISYFCVEKTIYITKVK